LSQKKKYRRRKEENGGGKKHGGVRKEGSEGENPSLDIQQFPPGKVTKLS
jgi:hypothetical protein